MATSNDLVQALAKGEFDADLDLLSDVIRERRKVARDAHALAVRLATKVGDKVRFTDEISPKYLVGLTATVVKLNGKSAQVKIDEGQYAGKYGNDYPVTCPLSLLQAVAA